MTPSARSRTGSAKVDPAGVPPPPWAGPGATRTRRRPAAALDQARIVAEALQIVDADGVQALTFRRLAEALGVTPMSLYWHVADKDELLELVGHAVLAEVRMPERAGDWRGQLRDVHRAMLEAVMRHPNTAEVVIGRARFGPAGLALFERILTILLQAGFTPVAAFDAYQSLYLFTLGFMATASRTPAFREVQREGLLYMRSLPEDVFPSIRAVVPVIGTRGLDEQFEIALDVVIAGIEERLAGRS